MAKLLHQIVQISDCHLFYDIKQSLLGVNPYESLLATLALIKTEKPDLSLLLISGDLSQDDSKSSYQLLLDIFKKELFPIYAVPGNHDDLTIMNTLFPKKHILLDQWQIILLNSQKTGFVEGLLADSELQFLKDCLEKYPKHNAIVMFHHQPMPVKDKWLDNIGLKNADVFWNTIEPFKNVKAVLFGHVHQEFNGTKESIACYGVPSTCIQFKRNRKDFALDNIPPGFRWIELYDDGTLKTGVTRLSKYIGTFEKDAKGYE
jgi:Icc protein